LRGQQLKRLRGGSHRSGVAAGLAGPAEQLEPWQDHGEAIHSKLSEDKLYELAVPITADAYGKELHDFADKKYSRFVAQQGNHDTAEYIKQQFKKMGLDVTEQNIEDPRIKEQELALMSADRDMALNTANHSNVIGILKGSDLANEVVLLGAHYDSVNWEDVAGPAPGVDDNGSGSALVLLVARMLAKSQPRRSVMFVAFNAEEEGLVGSQHFVSMYSKEGGKEKFGDVKAAFIVDEVAWPGRGSERRQAIFETKGEDKGTNSMVDTLAKYALLKNKTGVAGDGLGDGTHNFVVNYHGFGSDHISFLDEGIPAVLLIERDDDYHADTWGHSARDTFEHVDMDYGASMTRLALRSVAAFANPAM